MTLLYLHNCLAIFLLNWLKIIFSGGDFRCEFFIKSTELTNTLISLQNYDYDCSIDICLRISQFCRFEYQIYQ